MYIISLTYKTTIDEVEKHIEEHINFLEKYYALDKFVLSGRKNPRTGGIILANNISDIEVQEIIKEDPFYKNQIADYEITEFTPTKYDQRFKPFITE
jgi:uncharacterized protein YciI